MKDIRPCLRTFLMAYPPINAQVGGERIYPVKMKQGVTADSIVYNRISGGGTYVMEGLTGFTIQRFQFDCWSTSTTNANTLADHIRDRMDGYRGPMSDGFSPNTTVTVHGIFMIDQRDDYDDTVQMVRMSRDYSISFKEL